MVEELGQCVDDIEIKNTILSMPPMKAPDIDGLHAIFFNLNRTYWDPRCVSSLSRFFLKEESH